MKKFLSVLAFSLASLPIFADIYFPHRFFEMGLDVSAGAGQNVMGVADVFQKDILIDLPKIYKDMGSAGFVVNLNEKIDFHTDLIIGGWGAGIKLGESLNANVGISKDFFKLLAEGNDLDTEVTTRLSANLEAYAEASASVHMKFGGLKISATPTFFVPVFYLPNPNATLKYITNSDGKVFAKAEAGFDFYSVMDMSSCVVPKTDENGDTTNTVDFSAMGSLFTDPMDLLKTGASCGGVDIAAQIEFPLSEKMDLGIYANVPIVPGRLKNGLKGSADFSMDMDGFLTHYTTGADGEAFTMDYHVSDVELIAEEFTVNRPFKVGAELAFRPLPFVVLHPMLGVAMRNPFGKDFQLSSIYPEYSLTAGIHLFNILGLNLCTQYIDKVFAHSLGLYLNARLLELNVSVGTGSGDFLKSFAVGGLNVTVGLSMGF